MADGWSLLAWPVAIPVAVGCAVAALLVTTRSWWMAGTVALDDAQLQRITLGELMNA